MKTDILPQTPDDCIYLQHVIKVGLARVVLSRVQSTVSVDSVTMRMVVASVLEDGQDSSARNVCCCNSSSHVRI